MARIVKRIMKKQTGISDGEIETVMSMLNDGNLEERISDLKFVNRECNGIYKQLKNKIIYGERITGEDKILSNKLVDLGIRYIEGSKYSGDFVKNHKTLNEDERKLFIEYKNLLKELKVLFDDVANTSRIYMSEEGIQ